MTASSDNTSATIIEGQGSVSIASAAETFDVANGTGSADTGDTADVIISSAITGPGPTSGLNLVSTSTPAARVEFAGENTYYQGSNSTTTINGADVQVDSVYQISFSVSRPRTPSS